MTLLRYISFKADASALAIFLKAYFCRDFSQKLFLLFNYCVIGVLFLLANFPTQSIISIRLLGS